MDLLQGKLQPLVIGYVYHVGEGIYLTVSVKENNIFSVEITNKAGDKTNILVMTNVHFTINGLHFHISRKYKDSWNYIWTIRQMADLPNQSIN